MNSKLYLLGDLPRTFLECAQVLINGQSFNNPMCQRWQASFRPGYTGGKRDAGCSFKMISFANINKQYGKQLLFVDPSEQLYPGEKVGLVGAHVPVKTTVFRMLVVE